jgi:hypothetical protein
MKKSFGLFLASMLLFAGSVMADSRVHSWAECITSTSTNMKVFGNTTTSPVTYTATSYISKVDVKKIWIPQVATTPVVITGQLWDAPKGNTASSNARLILPINVPASATDGGPWKMDFVVQTGDGTDGHGIYFQYAPTIVESVSGVTINAFIEYDPLPVNKVIPQ